MQSKSTKIKALKVFQLVIRMRVGDKFAHTGKFGCKNSLSKIGLKRKFSIAYKKWVFKKNVLNVKKNFTCLGVSITVLTWM